MRKAWLRHQQNCTRVEERCDGQLQGPWTSVWNNNTAGANLMFWIWVVVRNRLSRFRDATGICICCCMWVVKKSCNHRLDGSLARRQSAPYSRISILPCRLKVRKVQVWAYWHAGLSWNLESMDTHRQWNWIFFILALTTQFYSFRKRLNDVGHRIQRSWGLFRDWTQPPVINFPFLLFTNNHRLFNMMQGIFYNRRDGGRNCKRSCRWWCSRRHVPFLFLL